MAEVLEINDAEELESYRLAWNALLPETPRASFFHSFDWFQRYWSHFGRDQKMRVLIVRSAGSTIGIVPLCVQPVKYHVGEVRVLKYPLSDWGMWYGPIGGNQTASYHLALRHLQSSPRDWDLIDLRWISGEPMLQESLRRAIHSNGWQSRRDAYQNSSIIRLVGLDWDSYRKKLNKKWRHEIARQDRVLCRTGQIEFVRHRPPGTAFGDGDPRWDLYEQCLQISRLSWQGSSTTGNTLSHDEVSIFLRDCHLTAARLGMLDLVLLRVDGKPAAFQYNYRFGSNLFGLRMGFDPQFGKRGVGKVLMSRTIQDSFRRGDESIDLGIGDFKFKRQFRTGVETSYQYTCYPRFAWKSRGVQLSRWLKDRIRSRSAAAYSPAATSA